MIIKYSESRELLHTTLKVSYDHTQVPAAVFGVTKP